MWLLIDLSLIIIVVIFGVIGYKKGLVRTFINLVGTIGAVLGSVCIGGNLSSWIYDVFIKNNLLINMEKQVLSSTESGLTAVEKALSWLPNFVVNMLPSFGVDISTISEQASQTEQQLAVSTATQIEAIVAPVIISLICIIVIIFSFILLSILVRFLSSVVGEIFKIPVLNGINKVFGALFGVIIGIIVVIIAVLVIKIAVPEPNDLNHIFNTVTIESTAIFEKLYDSVSQVYNNMQH